LLLPELPWSNGRSITPQAALGVLCLNFRLSVDLAVNRLLVSHISFVVSGHAKLDLFKVCIDPFNHHFA
jgi:hypothetical protein